MPRDLLKVRLNEIPDRGLDLTYAPADPMFASILEELADGEGASGQVTLRLELWPTRVDLKGELTSTIPQRCCRCLEPFVLPIDRSFWQVLMRTGVKQPETADEGEIELNLHELDRTELVGEVIDLAAILREELLLALPNKLLCKDDCKGICPGCGAELNSEPCTCKPATDPRWDVLKQLMQDS